LHTTERNFGTTQRQAERGELCNIQAISHMYVSAVMEESRPGGTKLNALFPKVLPGT
jgi:hypothetical protein